MEKLKTKAITDENETTGSIGLELSKSEIVEKKSETIEDIDLELLKREYDRLYKGIIDLDEDTSDIIEGITVQSKHFLPEVTLYRNNYESVLSRKKQKSEDNNKWVKIKLDDIDISQKKRYLDILEKSIDTMKNVIIPEIINRLEKRVHIIKESLLKNLDDGDPNIKDKIHILKKDIEIPRNKNLEYAKALKAICSSYEVLAQTIFNDVFLDAINTLKKIGGRYNEKKSRKIFKLPFTSIHLIDANERYLSIGYSTKGAGRGSCSLGQIIYFPYETPFEISMYFLENWRGFKKIIMKDITDDSIDNLDSLRFNQ